MLGSRITVARRKITSSVLRFSCAFCANRLPMPGMLRTPGMLSSLALRRSSISPPSTAIWPVSMRSIDFIPEIQTREMESMLRMETGDEVADGAEAGVRVLHEAQHARDRRPYVERDRV